MSASLTDKITGTTDGSRPVVTTLTAQKAVGASSLSVDSLAGWETGTAVHFALYQLNAQNEKIDSSQTDWKGIVTGDTAMTINPIPRAGTDMIYPIGTVVECMPTAAWADDLADGLLLQHNADGSHKAITTDTLSASGVITASAGVLSPNGHYPVNRKNNASSTVESTALLQSGWVGGAVGSASQSKTFTVTFPTPFTGKPIVVAISGGDQASGSVAYGSGGDIIQGSIMAKVVDITNTGFVIRLKAEAAWSSANIVYAQWIAIGA